MHDLRNFLVQSLIKLNDLLNLSWDKERIDNISDKFLIYLSELKKWNKAYNLTSIENEREIVIKHFIDSLLYLSFIPDKPLTIADVGTGAGFPGVPIAIVMPFLNITLIEPSWKKCAFLKNIKRTLKLENIKVEKSKAEEIQAEFDIVLSRALWNIGDFIQNCSHLLKKDGYFLISKAIKIQEELKSLPKKCKAEIKEFDLPDINSSHKGGKRYIIKIEKCES